MAGVTHDEVSRIVDETVDFSRLNGITKDQVMEVMEKRYDGYSFSRYADVVFLIDVDDNTFVCAISIQFDFEFKFCFKFRH